MGNGMNNNFMGSVNLSDEEMEDMNLEVSHNEIGRASCRERV